MGPEFYGDLVYRLKKTWLENFEYVFIQHDYRLPELSWPSLQLLCL